MKKLVLSLIVVTLLISSPTLFAQVVSKGDTLIIGPLNAAGQPVGALNEAIKGDTTATGERAHSVYKLHNNAQYILTEPLATDFPLVLVADKPDEQTKPPIVRAGLKEDGSNVQPLMQFFNSATLKNIWASGINVTGEGNISWHTININASGKTFKFDGCIMENPYSGWTFFSCWAPENSLYFQDCYFKNHGLPDNDSWNGNVTDQQVYDTLSYRNTTFFNFGCHGVNGGSGTRYLVVDHCSFVNSAVHPIGTHGLVEAYFTNNLIVNGHVASDNPREIAAHYDQEIKGLINLSEIQWVPQTLDSLYGITPDQRIVQLKNNCWYYTAPVQQYWADNDTVFANPWMNNWTAEFFKHKDAEWQWTIDRSLIGKPDTTLTMLPQPYFLEENTMNEDPGFVNIGTSDADLAANMVIRRQREQGLTVDKIKWFYDTDFLAFTYPLTEDLSYTNTTLKTAGLDGKPVGSLQWWPEYDYTTAVEANTPAEMPVSFVLEANYPNPFNPTTHIRYSVPEKSHVELRVFNVLGAEVATLVEKTQIAGNYSVSFDAKDLTSGVYFYQLKNGNQTITRKMTLLKQFQLANLKFYC